MTDFYFDPNDNVSEQYLADQRTTEQYARAAKQASEKRDIQFNSNGMRKPRYEQRETERSRENAVEQREQAFRDMISDNRNVDQIEDTNQYDLDALDQQEKSLVSEKRRREPVSRSKPRKSGKKSGNKVLQDILGGLQQSLFLLFSKRPMQIFHLNLHWGSIGILALLNILLVSIFNSVAFSKGLKEALQAVITKVGTGKVFAMSLLSQLLSILFVVIMVFVLSIILQSEKRPLKQFFQTAVLSTIPYSIVLIPSIIISIFSPLLGMLIALAGKIHGMIYLYAGFQKGHPTRKNSPYWIFFLLILLLVFLQYLLARWTLV